ncbi:MAG: ABC transporter substrate-binding protein [Propionicimonas sp.]|uniref:ABC transporter substrate-binding protein n=1 Tax=Propionicimonas sp. TaxID=1955623 RepID=UPI002B2163E9|nr:ABC transporter substrate-binding protein [Propionicimonas sp.]MEA4943690.1 ABC transporter substrate-binding protein [Propionicimonas sp.]MEA5052231.1 ABC transporter substrate-binding protein [Propionicimonas sp.]MEA5119240.1 ABC transporter substrate-binding protein [Propionicimonas sp.]
MKRIVAALAATTLGSLLLAGCAATPTAEPSGSPSAAPASSATAGPGGTLASVETLFGTVEVPQPADGDLTVIALGWSDAEVALALGAKPVAVYDWQGFGADNKGVGPWATSLFGDATPTVIQNVGDDLDYETIASLDPDLILNTRSAGDEAQYQRLSTIAPTISAPPGTGAFATTWDAQTRQVAQALGKTTEGDALVAAIGQQLAAAKQANPGFAGKTAVTGTKFGDAYGAYIAGDARWDLIEALGFVQNPPVLALETSGFFAPVPAEKISVFDADVAILFPIGYSLDELKADPLIASLTVVKENRAIYLDAEQELSQAFSAASPLSIPIAVAGIVPQLAAIIS